MPLTRREYTGNGSTTLYNIDFSLGYINKDYVYIYLDGNEPENQLNYTWRNDNQIELNDPVEDGIQFYIRRIVPRDQLINNYTDGALLREDNLNDSYLQTLMIMQEVQDGFITVDDEFLILAKIIVSQDLDMNWNQILNLPYPAQAESPVRLKDIKEVTGSIIEDAIKDVIDKLTPRAVEIPRFTGNTFIVPYTVTSVFVTVNGRSLSPLDVSILEETESSTRIVLGIEVTQYDEVVVRTAFVDDTPSPEPEPEPTDAEIKEANSKKLSKLQNQILDTDPSPTIVCIGDSITEGYDYQSANKIANNLRDGDVKGAATIAPMQYPERLKAWADYFQYGGARIASVKNWGYSGDTVLSSYNRFDSINGGDPECDIAIMMFGINDNTDNSETLADFISGYLRLIRKYQDFGCGVVLMTSTLDKGGIRPDTDNYRKAMMYISDISGCPLIDTTDMIQGDTSPLYSDGTHLTDEGYNLLALRVYAALSNTLHVSKDKYTVPSGEFVHPCSSADFSGAPSGATQEVFGSSLTNKATRYLSSGSVYFWLFYTEADVTEFGLVGSVGDVTIKLDGGLDYNKGPYVNQSNYNKFVESTGANQPTDSLGMILGKGWHTLEVIQNSGDSYLNGIKFKTLSPAGYDTSTVRSYSMSIGSPGAPSDKTVFTVPSYKLKQLVAGNRTNSWFFTQPSISISVRSDGPSVNLIASKEITYSLIENSVVLNNAPAGTVNIYPAISLGFPSGTLNSGEEVNAAITIPNVTLTAGDAVTVNLKYLPEGLGATTYFDQSSNIWKIKVFNFSSSGVAYGTATGNVTVQSVGQDPTRIPLEIDSVSWDGSENSDMVITLKNHSDAYGRVTLSVRN